MAWRRYTRRKRYSRRTGNKRPYRRSYRRNRGNRRRTRRFRQRVYHFKRAGGVYSVAYNAVTSPTGLTNSIYFAITDVFGVSDFSNLFDAFRLNCVVLKFIPEFGVMNAGTFSNQTPTQLAVPQLHVVWDYDDNDLTPISDMTEYQTYKTMQFQGNRTYNFKVYPASLTMKFRTAVNTAYSSKRRDWIDMNQPNTAHYGFKYGIDGGTASVNYDYRFKIRPFYYFSCKHVR